MIDRLPECAEDLIGSLGSIMYLVTDESGNDLGAFNSRTGRYDEEGARLVTPAGEWTVIEESTKEKPGRLIVAHVHEGRGRLIIEPAS